MLIHSENFAVTNPTWNQLQRLSDGHRKAKKILKQILMHYAFGQVDLDIEDADFQRFRRL